METRLIKRYANRKLYDTRASGYITLGNLFEMIRDGEVVKVVDNNSNADITKRIIVNTLFEKEKNISEEGVLEFFFKVIRSGDGTFSSFLKETFEGGEDVG